MGKTLHLSQTAYFRYRFMQKVRNGRYCVLGAHFNNIGK